MNPRIPHIPAINGTVYVRQWEIKVYAHECDTFPVLTYYPTKGVPLSFELKILLKLFPTSIITVGDMEEHDHERR